MLQRFFILCSGADRLILKECSHGEQNKYVGIGATVFFTAIMATIAASYALYTVFDNYATAILFGVIWGLLIFNLDRYIVSTLKKREKFSSELLQAAPRLLLALIIAIVISKPLELKIFEKEIDRVLISEKNAFTLQNKAEIANQYTPDIAELQGEINGLKNEISSKENEVNTLYDIYIAEAEGRKGTELIGKGPVYKEKREKHDAALAELQTIRTAHTATIAETQSKIAALKTKQDTQVLETQVIIDKFDGLMARINALDKLPRMPSFFIFLLFLAIESAPILAKLLSPKGTYDIKLDDEEAIVKNWAAQNKYQRKMMRATDREINDQVYGDLASEAELYEQRKRIAQSLLKDQAQGFYNRQQRVINS